MTAPVETKVKASTAAAAVSGMAIWALGRYVFRGAVPDVVASWIYVIVPGLLAFGAGYLARHTPRPVTAGPAIDEASAITHQAAAALAPAAAPPAAPGVP